MTRCFVSLELPPPLLQLAISLQNDLKNTQSIKAKFTAQENIHLTLKFLGEQPASMVENVKRCLAEINFQALNVEAGHVGVFSRRDVRIVWLHLKGVEALQKQVDDALKEWFKPEERFMSHITLARVKTVLDRPNLFSWLDTTKIELPELPVSKIHLMKSTLTPDGPLYETICSYLAKKY